MKKIFPFLISWYSIQVQSQTISPTSTISPVPGSEQSTGLPKDHTVVELPEAVRKKHATENPDATDIVWKVEKNDYWVRYTDPKNKLLHVIVYNKHGSIIRKENEVSKALIPDQLKIYIDQKYPGENYTVWTTTNDKGAKLFYVPREKAFLWFNEKGKIIEEKPIKTQ